MSDEQQLEPSGVTRRRFVQAAAAAGAIGAVWSEPIIRGTAAGAATGVSVNGKCTGAFIVWSNDADTWMATNSGFSNSTSQTDNGQMTGDSPPPLATYTWAVMNSVCPTLTASVTVQATPGPEGTTSATGSTVSIISGASCHFANISTTLVMGGGSGTGGSIDFTPGDSTFMWYNAPTSGDNPEVLFDIVC